jgi:hypothetical protein
VCLPNIVARERTLEASGLKPLPVLDASLEKQYRQRACCTIQGMPNIAASLKTEISRIARKEVRAETLALKNAVSVYRAEIAALKRRAQALERQLRGLSKRSARPLSSEENEATSSPRRFSAKGLASQRRRLELSAQD